MTGAAEALVFYPDNLMRTVAAAPQQDWAALVADHLATLLSNYSADRITPPKEERFSEIQGLIRTRLYPESSDEARICVCRPVADGLTQRIVLDSVNTIAQVTPDLPGRWNVGEDELFAVAERNTRADAPLSVLPAGFPEGVPPWFQLAGADYTSAEALWLGDYADVIGRAGALFAIASEGTIRAAPINGVDVLEAAHVLGSLTAHHFVNDPRPISPHVYRWHDGHIELAIHIRSTPDSLELYPTDEFWMVLNRLG
ncbi:hypothetical protein ACWIGI_09870 [Nocardia sp. NPDC055321]